MLAKVSSETPHQPKTELSHQFGFVNVKSYLPEAISLPCCHSKLECCLVRLLLIYFPPIASLVYVPVKRSEHQQDFRYQVSKIFHWVEMGHLWLRYILGDLLGRLRLFY